MSNSNQPANSNGITVSSLHLEDVIAQQFNLLSALVVLVVIASGLIVGFRWWALNIHP